MWWSELCLAALLDPQAGYTMEEADHVPDAVRSLAKIQASSIKHQAIMTAQHHKP
jgi:hypothetical protein